MKEVTAMAAQSAGFAAEFEEFADEMVSSGRYASVREVLDAAKEALLEPDDLDLEYVRKAVAEGRASGTYKGDIFAELRAKHNLPPRN